METEHGGILRWWVEGFSDVHVEAAGRKNDRRATRSAARRSWGPSWRI